MGGIKQYEKKCQTNREPAEHFVRVSCNYLNERGYRVRDWGCMRNELTYTIPDQTKALEGSTKGTTTVGAVVASQLGACCPELVHRAMALEVVHKIFAPDARTRRSFGLARYRPSCHR